MATKADSRFSPQRPAQDPLAAARAVALGSLEEGDPELERTADNSARLLLGIPLAVALLRRLELIDPKSDLGNLLVDVDGQITYSSRLRCWTLVDTVLLQCGHGHRDPSAVPAVRHEGRCFRRVRYAF